MFEFRIESYLLYKNLSTLQESISAEESQRSNISWQGERTSEPHRKGLLLVQLPRRQRQQGTYANILGNITMITVTQAYERICRT